MFCTCMLFALCSPYSALWFPSEGGLFSTRVIDESMLSVVGYTRNNGG